MTLAIGMVTTDCADPKALASFWAAALDTTVSGDYGDRTYMMNADPAPGDPSSGARRQDRVLGAGGGYEYRGRFRLRADYSYFEQSSNSYGQSNSRHRISALFGTRIFWSINFVAQAAVQLTDYPDGILLSYETYALVRDDVTAEERQAIEVKGIRRAIRPYAVTGLLDEAGADEVISSEIDGMSLRIDVRHLDDARRQAVLAELADITDRLSTRTRP